jgi:UDPglucose 6-dehydrogenase
MDGADAAVVVTQWSELKQADWARAVERMRQPVLFDGRNLLDPSRMSELGFTCMAVGRP